MMTTKTKKITTFPPTYAEVEKSKYSENARMKVALCSPIHFSHAIQLKDIFPHGLTPFSGQDEQSYSVFLFLPFRVNVWPWFYL